MQNAKRQQLFGKHCKLRKKSIDFNWSIKKDLDVGSRAISSEIGGKKQTKELSMCKIFINLEHQK